MDNPQDYIPLATIIAGAVLFSVIVSLAFHRAWQHEMAALMTETVVAGDRRQARLALLARIYAEVGKLIREGNPPTILACNGTTYAAIKWTLQADDLSAMMLEHRANKHVGTGNFLIGQSDTNKEGSFVVVYGEITEDGCLITNRDQLAK